MDLPLDPHDALTLENDVIGVRIWGPPNQPTLSIGKSDLWDRRWFGERNPLVTMQRIKECATTGSLGELIFQDNNHTIYDVYNKYATPCPKPGVQLILGTPFGKTARVDELEGGIEITVEGRGKRLGAKIWVHLTRPLVVLEISTAGLREGDFLASVYRHRDTILPGGQEELPRIGPHALPEDEEQLPLPKCLQGDDIGLVQDLGRELTFPGGFAFAASCRIIGADHHLRNVEGETGLGTSYHSESEGRIDHGILKRYSPINQAPGSSSTATFGHIPRSFAMIAALMTSQDGEKPVAEALNVLDQATALGIDGLKDEQRKERQCALRSNRAMARVGKQEIAAPGLVLPRMRVAGGYYGDIPLCSVNTTKLCFQDAALWHADFHLNEIRGEPMLTLGQFEELLPYCEMIATLLPSAIENAQDVYSLPGAMYPLVHFPFRYRGVAHTNLTWEQDLGMNGLVAKPLWLYYRYTGDMEYLENLAYPVLRECSRFVDAYLEEGDDGLLHIVPTVSPEHWGITPNFERNRDCTSALTLSKYLLNAAASAAKTLGRDDNEAEGWINSARRMAPYPVYKTEKGPVWVDVEGAPPIEYNIPVPLT
ncbi:MAG: hypothetical protein HXS50_02275, partial [Theionarchaea archaeon]|nr:hypothetical protein [Theionarchaea archaeon]